MWARHLILAAALVIGLTGLARAGLDHVNAVSNNSATGEITRLAQSSLAVIVAPKRIDTDTEIVDFTGRAVAPGEVTLTVNGQPVPLAQDGSFRIRQQVLVGRSKLVLVVEGSHGDKAEHRVLVLRSAAVDTESIEYGTYHALIIGNNIYQTIGDLKMASSDAEAMAEVLRERYGFQIELLIDATRSDIITALARKRAQLTENDNLLIYYAGHGILDIDSGEGYWLPVDAERSNPVNWISLNSITVQLRAMSAKHVMVIADSCYSGVLTRNTEADLKTGAERTAWLTRMNARRSRTALTSGGLEPVLDAGGGKYSVFANAVLETLRTNTGVLDGQSLFNSIKRPVVVNADQTPEYADVRKAGHDGGDFLFVPVVAAISLTTKEPEASATTISRADASAIMAQETAFWQSIQSGADPAMFEAYLEQYPTGTFAVLARLRVKQFEKKPAAEEEAQRLAEAEAQRLAAEEEAQRLAEAEAQRLAAEEEAQRLVIESDALKETQVALLAVPPISSFVVDKNAVEHDDHLKSEIKKYFNKQKFRADKMEVWSADGFDPHIWGFKKTGWSYRFLEMIDINYLTVKSISGMTFFIDIEYIRMGEGQDRRFEFATAEIEKTSNSYKVINFDRNKKFDVNQVKAEVQRIESEKFNSVDMNSSSDR